MSEEEREYFTQSPAERCADLQNKYPGLLSAVQHNCEKWPITPALPAATSQSPGERSRCGQKKSPCGDAKKPKKIKAPADGNGGRFHH